MLVEHGIIFHIVEDLNDVSLTLLQIQAAVTTLTLTIIDLLSGNVSDSYMGIPISMFYLEKRPFLLKQKAVILTEFLAKYATKSLLKKGYKARKYKENEDLKGMIKVLFVCHGTL